MTDNFTKNFLFISPNYPSIYYKFCENLKMQGFSVFGIGDAPENELKPELKNALTTYIQLKRLEDYSELSSAVVYLTSKYGKLSGLESNNEYWLKYDAMLRRDFDIEGLKPPMLESYQQKSKMKDLFNCAGVAVVPHLVTRDAKHAQDFANKHGYPIFAKPNIGIGANGAQKISSEEGLLNFFQNPLQEDYIFEIYIEGNLYSYDGLTDKHGNIVFEAAHQFITPIDKLKESGSECVYYTLRNIPNKLKKAGAKTVAAAELSGRFFHIEYFELTKPIKDIGKIGDFVGIEVNMRPPGGCTPEMINIAKNIDVYALWAECMANGTARASAVSDEFCCVNIGRHEKKKYLHDITQINIKFPHNFMFSEKTSSNDNPFGNTEIIGKFKTLEESQEFCAFVIKTQ